MEPTDLIGKLEKLKGVGLNEIAHVTTFKGYRTAKHGTQPVTIEIHDRGPAFPRDLRYHCVATTDDGKMATGNPAATVDEVLALVHWSELDRTH